ncbi:CDP-glucose 4,6-dehydratase [hydrothermal vent metagenome]|uniref:CDP-glucose 4,6-dehydratase n=1 Tax=hydrothermal vent metagenome TaxID=652676 RepID=A0A3B0YSE3_9ZZZZ
MSMLQQFKDAKVLVTGHTGFKGSWLSLWLNNLGAEVSGISVDIPSEPSHFQTALLSEQIDDYRLDLRDSAGLKKLVDRLQPDFVFHLAAQALVRPSYINPLETISTNTLGTANILDALRVLKKPVVAVMITSDKAYDNVEWVWGYRETDRLGGKDPYSASKGMAELVIRTYVESFFNSGDSNVRVGITRAGNVIGGGDWAIDRIVPDCMKAWSRNETVDIRSPEATRPWQHVLEPLSGYLSLACNLANSKIRHGEAYNFGPDASQNFPVSELIDEMCKYWTKVRWNDVSSSQTHVHEAGLLKLNCDKALADLDWMPSLKFKDTVRMTVQWYKAYYEEKLDSMHQVTFDQITEYTRLARDKGVMWAK